MTGAIQAGSDWIKSCGPSYTLLSAGVVMVAIVLTAATAMSLESRWPWRVREWALFGLVHGPLAGLMVYLCVCAVALRMSGPSRSLTHFIATTAAMLFMPAIQVRLSIRHRQKAERRRRANGA